LLSEAEQALGSAQYLRVMDLLDEAAAIAELGEGPMALRDQATVALEYLREERDLFDQGDWEYALPGLWRMHENNPDNPDVVRLMIDSYYNLGLRDLQRGDAQSALEKFQEALALTEADADLDRLASFAAAYSQRSADMLYRIFVKYQKFR
jgi:tetratricopeptide (TPR) repeat protein